MPAKGRAWELDLASCGSPATCDAVQIKRHDQPGYTDMQLEIDHAIAALSQVCACGHSYRCGQNAQLRETDLVLSNAEQVSKGYRCCYRCSRVAIDSTTPSPWRICSHLYNQEREIQKQSMASNHINITCCTAAYSSIDMRIGVMVKFGL